jgi:aldose 1-epimerase
MASREPETEDVRLRAGDAEATIAAGAGCRLASLRVAGHELLVEHGPDAMHWGAFPMVPWAGRVRRGRFSFAGFEHQLPLRMPPHAIHGTVLDRPWRLVERPAVLECDLGPDWPFEGFARQAIALADDRLDMTLEVHATGWPMPASCGWHPWFRREIGGASARLDLRAGFMELRDDDGIPSGERVPPPPGPWDDCFGDVEWPVVVEWPGVLTLSVASDCDHVVVYDEVDYAVCVEPQTAPPNALNRYPDVVEPGRPLVATTTWRWHLPS